MTRDRAIEVGLGLIVLAMGAALAVRELDARPEPVSHPIAVALMEETGDAIAWPPPSSEVGPALPMSAAVTAIEQSAQTDGGSDAGDDGGPPLPDPPPDTAELRVRRDERLGIHFLEVVLGGASFEDSLPMVVVLHGRGGRAEIPGGPFLGLTHAVRVIVPQAPNTLGSGYEWLPVYVGQGLVDRLSSSLFAQTSRVAALVRSLAADRPTVGRVIVSGFSQGGLLTLTMALYHDDIVGEAFPLSCWLPAPLEPSYRRADVTFPRIRSMHGSEDGTIPLAPTGELFTRLAGLGFDVSLHTFAGVGHTISEDENRLFHLWLEAAICRVVADSECEHIAETAASATSAGIELVDAGPQLDPTDGGLDAAATPDAGTDGGRPRRARDASTGVVRAPRSSRETPGE